MNLSRIGLLTLACGIATVRLMSAAESTRDSDYDYDPPAPGSYSLPVIKPAADGALVDSNNKSVQLRDLTRGRITLLSFIYTRCAAPKACPYATGVLNQIHDLSVDDKILAKSMRLVSLSFDPDTRHSVSPLTQTMFVNKDRVASGASPPRSPARN